MSTRTATPLDQQTADELSAAYHRCFETFDADDDLFTPDALFDMMPPLWRFQIQGPRAFLDQLASIASDDVSVEILRTVPTATGFVTEHEETQRGETTEVARRVPRRPARRDRRHPIAPPVGVPAIRPR